jgi:hypothetical protein
MAASSEIPHNTENIIIKVREDFAFFRRKCFAVLIFDSHATGR